MAARKFQGYGVRVSGDGRGDGEYPGGRTLREARKAAQVFVGYRTQGHMRSSADVKVLGYDREGRAFVVDVYEGRVDYPNRSGFIPGTKIPVSTHAHPTVAEMKRGNRRTGVPSVKTILTYLGPGLRNEYGDGAVIKARAIRRIMQTTPRSSRDVADSMNAINKELNAHGVEFVAQHPGDMNPGEHFDYVNMGDTYTPTVIYHRGKFKVMSWGDLVESLERRGKRFQ